MKIIFTLTLILGLQGSVYPVEAGGARATSPQQDLAAVPAPEIPAKAAELVRSARTREQATVTIEVVKAAIARNPQVAIAIVGAIAKAVPDQAALSAAAAAAEQPEQAAKFARAAAAAAPAKVRDIVAAVCRAAPQDYRKIALQVAEVASDATSEILQALTSVFPELKPGIERALAKGSYAAPSLAFVLDSSIPPGPPGGTATTQGSASSVAASTTVPGTLPRGPSIAPPYLPLPAGGTSVNPSNSGPVPRGERNYAAP